jgi:hypothetical protein
MTTSVLVAICRRFGGMYCPILHEKLKKYITLLLDRQVVRKLNFESSRFLRCCSMPTGKLIIGISKYHRAFNFSPRAVIIIIIIIIIFSSSVVQRGLWPSRPRGFVIAHNDAPQSVTLLWTSDQLVAEIST